MATVLITGDDFSEVDRLRGVVESLGHFVLHAVTTENVLEDVTLNNVILVYASRGTQPFTEWEVSEMLHGDPTLPRGLAVVLLHSGDFDRRRFANSSFDDEMNSTLNAQNMADEIVRHLGDEAAPETTDPSTRAGLN